MKTQPLNILHKNLLRMFIVDVHEEIDGEEMVYTPSGLQRKLIERVELLPLPLAFSVTKYQLYQVRKQLWKEGFLEFVRPLLDGDGNPGYYGAGYTFKKNLFTNADRQRKYGLRVGDKVYNRFYTNVPYGYVSSISSSDNNSVLVWYPDDPFYTFDAREVAEYLTLVTPIDGYLK